MNAEAARELLFGDILVCDEVRPAAFVPGTCGDAALQGHCARTEALLRALAVVEDGVRNEEPEQPVDNALHRIEAKLDLLAALVATFAAHDTDPFRALQWSARGACVPVDAPVPADSEGLFRVQPVDWLPTPLVLPAAVLACEQAENGAVAWLRFGALSPSLEAALERHLFRLHRRAIAERRRPR